MPSRRPERDELAALCDFVAGSSLKQIARRYRWTIVTTEAHIRDGFLIYGFGPGTTIRPQGTSRPVRVVAHYRPRP